MLTVEEYRERVLSLARPLPSENCPVGSGFGRVLTQDIVARFPVPPFTNSAMDGYAVRAADTAQGAAATTPRGTPESPRQDTSPNPTILSVIGDIPAGATLDPAIGVGQAARIMTGAPLPQGADSVVAVEDTDQDAGDAPLPGVVQVPPTASGKNVRLQGEDVQPGEVVVPAGTIWTPAASAAAASVGYGEVSLRRRPRVAVISTGTELVPAGEPLGFGQVPDSNSLLLAGLVQQFGADPVLVQTVPDDVEQFLAVLRQAADTDADIVVTTGAVSAGAFEVVRQALEGTVDFVKVAMQPGKPQACGTLSISDRDMAFLGLPGNPVSVFVSAWVFLRPLIDAFQGREEAWPALMLPVIDGWKTPPGRRQYVPVVVTDEGIRRTHRLGSGSHLVASLHLAQALAVVPADVERVVAGDLLEVHWIDPQPDATASLRAH